MFRSQNVFKNIINSSKYDAYKNKWVHLIADERYSKENDFNQLKNTSISNTRNNLKLLSKILMWMIEKIWESKLYDRFQIW